MDKDYKEIQDRMALAKQNYTGSFCCLDMDLMLQNDESNYNIKYDPVIREYCLESKEGYIRTIEFCPWCGKQLPKSLRTEWFDILETEYSLDPWIPQQRKQIPIEFLTDEWWKNRKL